MAAIQDFDPPGHGELQRKKQMKLHHTFHSPTVSSSDGFTIDSDVISLSVSTSSSTPGGDARGRLGCDSSTPSSSHDGSARFDFERRICFGMLYQVKCRRVPESKEAFEEKLKAHIQPDGFVDLSLRGSGSNFAVLLPDHKIIAHLNTKTALAIDGLNKLKIDYNAHYDVKLNRDNRQTKAKASKRAGHDHLLINVDINGPESTGESAGEFLSGKDIFLQSPLRKLTCGYRNPQFFQLTERSTDGVWSADAALETTHSSALIDNIFTNVLDKLNEHRVVSDSGHDLLNVQLLKHQKAGQDFMLRRETDCLEDQKKFWQLDQDDENNPVHRHIVTGNEREHAPAEPCGGILADDMGLGKTLTTISLIVNSLERATSFSRQRTFSGYRNCQNPRTQATLIIVPSIQIMDIWAEEIKARVKPEVLRVMKYHGHERVQHFEGLQACNVVLTTYGTVTTEYRKRKTRDVLYRLDWFRIVLDEAHTIRSQTTQQFKAITTLEAKHHWCLTGTPIANRVEDLGALLRFVHVPELDDPDCFREHVGKVTRKSITRGCRVLERILAPICLRRTKSHLRLPHPCLTQCLISFTEAEAEAYKALRHQNRSAMDDGVSGRNLKRERHTMLQVILQLRRFCNHGLLIAPPTGKDEEHLDFDEVLTMLQEQEEDICSSCGSCVSIVNQFEDRSSGVLLNCSHIICRSCSQVEGALSESKQFECHICDQMALQQEMQSSVDLIDVFSDLHLTGSSKLNKLLENLQQTKGSEKSLVFSVWKNTIDLASQLCTLKGVNHVCIDGNTPGEQRREALQKFTSDPNVSALLMTFGTGALGLNLTAATCVHLLEPQWNPTVEEQAIGRAVRIGQENRTTVIRYVVKGSVEEQIQGYQKRKTRLAAGGFGEHSEAETQEQTKLLTASFLYDDP